MKPERNKVTIIMYHYVRDLINSRYPKIKGLDVNLFKEQLIYLKRNYTFITMEQLVDAFYNKIKLPNNPVLLTFDDAYIDHYTFVFPILNEMKIQGSFYIPSEPIKERKLLDVNKIHFILASRYNTSEIIKEIFELLDYYKEEYNLHDKYYYYKKLAIASRFDNKDVIFIKRLLQSELPEQLRKTFNSQLFNRFVEVEESILNREIYLSIDQIKTMKRNGMHIGSHGVIHYWLETLSKNKQFSEISKSLDFLKEIGSNLDYITMCYPYGSYNKETIEILKDLDYKIALTTEVDTVDLENNNPLELPRIDTNDILKFHLDH